MLVATAGHIDHGKTRLVKALTGVDTDRLPEERSRGISIDLGFAYWPLADGRLIGFVDVPGHERFVHNMLAGVCGIDFALLAVAADDGVMPQTIEHLQILDLLGIRRGLAVITKIDRVAAARLRQVEADLAALLAGSGLAGIPRLPVCAPTGEGMEALRAHLLAARAAHASRYQEGQHFRLAIDRVFTVAGTGTVVTGTVFNGEVRADERMVVSPQGARARVRGIQIRGQPVAQARAGERCALNLAGIEVGSLARGDWLLGEAIHAPSRRLYVRLALLATERGPLAHGSPVHLHLATADVPARVAVLRGEALAPGGSALARIVTARPIGALARDRFILRDRSARRTLGGGTVIDPLAEAGRSSADARAAARAAELAALEQGSPEAALAALLALPDRALDCRHWETIFDLRPERAAAAYRGADAVLLGRERRQAVPRARADALRERVLTVVGEFHRAEPRAPGIELEALRQRLALWLTADAFAYLVRGLVETRQVQLEGASVRIAGHDPTANEADQRMWHAVEPALSQGGLAPPGAVELARRLHLDARALRDLLHRKCSAGALVHLGEDLFLPKATLAVHAANAALVARGASRGLFTVAQFRDATGISRALSIKVLERLDLLGVTQRLGDVRKMHKNFVPLLGTAKPSFRPQPRQAGRP